LEFVCKVVLAIFGTKFFQIRMGKSKSGYYFCYESLLIEDVITVWDSTRNYIGDIMLPVMEKHYREEMFTSSVINHRGGLNRDAGI